VFLLLDRLVSVTKYRHQEFSAAHLDRMETIKRDVRGLRVRANRVQRRSQTHAPAGQLPVHRGDLPPGQQPQRGVVQAAPQEFPDLRRHYWRAKRLWSGRTPSGSVGGAPITVLRQYIEQQNRPS